MHHAIIIQQGVERDSSSHKLAHYLMNKGSMLLSQPCGTSYLIKIAMLHHWQPPENLLKPGLYFLLCECDTNFDVTNPQRIIRHS